MNTDDGCSDSWEVYNIVETRKAHQKCTIRIKVRKWLLLTVDNSIFGARK